jgi:cytoskeletal protein CcmA (bactofilin family)
MLFNKKVYDDVVADAVKPQPVMPDPAIVAAKARRPEGAATRSVIDPWLHITGNLEGEAELQIEGHIRGDIRCTKLIINKAATVDGNVTADEIIIRGTVTGIVRGNRVVLQEGACVRNEIHYKRLCIEEDAIFEGTIRLRDDDAIDALRAVAGEMKSPKKAKAKAEEPKPAGEDLRAAARVENGAAVEHLAPIQVEALAGAESDPAALVMSPLASSEVKGIRSQSRDRRVV